MLVFWCIEYVICDFPENNTLKLEDLSIKRNKIVSEESKERYELEPQETTTELPLLAHTADSLGWMHLTTPDGVVWLAKLTLDRSLSLLSKIGIIFPFTNYTLPRPLYKPIVFVYNKQTYNASQYTKIPLEEIQHPRINTILNLLKHLSHLTFFGQLYWIAWILPL
uniref:Uncharacterized protein n=1 Tax=Clastoptera arizonana TaxID=38151 RepID=A0A1B6CVB3_9HEMI